MVTSEEEILTEKRNEGTFWNDGNLDLSDDYVGVYVYKNSLSSLFRFVFFCFFFFFLFMAAPIAYGSSQARGQIGAIAAGLHHSHSTTRSEPHLRPIPRLMAMPYP